VAFPFTAYGGIDAPRADSVYTSYESASPSLHKICVYDCSLCSANRFQPQIRACGPS